MRLEAADRLPGACGGGGVLSGGGGPHLDPLPRLVLVVRVQKNTTLYQKYQLKENDLNAIALHKVIMGDKDFLFWSSYAVSYFSSAFGITNYFKRGNGSFIDSWRIFSFAFVCGFLSLLWKVAYLYFLFTSTGFAAWANFLFWALSCFVPQVLYTVLHLSNSIPKSVWYLLFKQPQIILMSSISPMAYDVDLKNYNEKKIGIFSPSKQIFLKLKFKPLLLFHYSLKL